MTALVCQLSSKGGVAKPLFLVARFYDTHPVLCLRIYLTNAVHPANRFQLKRLREKLGAVTAALHAVL